MNYSNGTLQEGIGFLTTLNFKHPTFSMLNHEYPASEDGNLRGIGMVEISVKARQVFLIFTHWAVPTYDQHFNAKDSLKFMTDAGRTADDAIVFLGDFNTQLESSELSEHECNLLGYPLDSCPRSSSAPLSILTNSSFRFMDSWEIAAMIDGDEVFSYCNCKISLGDIQGCHREKRLDRVFVTRSVEVTRASIAGAQIPGELCPSDHLYYSATLEFNHNDPVADIM